MKLEPEDCIPTSLCELFSENSRQLIELNGGQRNLCNGFLGRTILRMARTEEIELQDMWHEIGRVFLFAEPFKGGALYYLWERTGKVVTHLRVTEEEWNALIRDLTPENLKREITTVADWQEAILTATAYTIFKECKQVFDRDELTRMIYAAVYEAKSVNVEEGPSPKLRYRKRLDFIEAAKHKPFLEGHPTTSKAWLQGETKDWRHEKLDQWLFFVWPLVRHGHWNHEEILRVIEKRFPGFDKYPCGDAAELRKHCRTQLGLRIEVPRGQPHKRSSPPGADVAMNLRFSGDRIPRDESSTYRFSEK